MYPPGPLGFFLPPPGQVVKDPATTTRLAEYSTYPSRLRTGATSLVQPERVMGGPREREAHLAQLDAEFALARSSGASTPRVDSPAPGRISRTTTTTMSGRRAGRVNYAEADESDDDEESEESDIEEAASDPDDDNYGERRRKRDREAEKLAHSFRAKKKAAEAEPGWSWLGDRVPGDRVKSVEVRGLTAHRFVPEDALAAEAERPELLVPINLDIEVPATDHDEGIKIKDRFMWNANEPFVKPGEFAKIFCRDVGISEAHASTIADLIASQVEEAQSTVVIDLATPDATEDDVSWSDDDAMDEDELPEPDCRIIINLDVQIFAHVLRDRIEWDLSSPLPPSEFARHYCAELGLTGEAVPLITHAIHEELLKHKRDALELELFARTHPLEQAKWEKSANHPKTNFRHGARGLVGVWRDWWERDEFSPILIELTAEDMAQRESERSRDARSRMRALTSKRGAARLRYY
ncbi:SNF5-domain-containing protein [Cutaneotrichosporon oleaginosum]|uniref:SNF5-domain-containing protein n=1 Tax=Cutaneotrichosporon oleaginosum TaxID=879819 RepID=A0A0J0XX71_9TREE|nr:SNF5-domain-containing protein [Cutaneotrichosporon oleaginosum]KLT45638.1 SNF5-domain-containing protein [Cutaneotrichosporon oleaginosum]TXT04569.1 hypothetical protein COLE_07388 [Cutaneotrichosporon oleaginosum]